MVFRKANFKNHIQLNFIMTKEENKIRCFVYSDCISFSWFGSSSLCWVKFG
jgi:hypothetical protein